MKISRWKIFIIILIWMVEIGISAWWNVRQDVAGVQNTNLETARSFFQFIVTTRAWNTSMEGVYVPVSENIQPNPYLDVPDRDLLFDDGTHLTLINPTSMTRKIAELAEEKNKVQLHITSLDPIHPANQAYDWEHSALQTFENKEQSEYYHWDTKTGNFYYMAPLVTEESCLKCHRDQGYQVGDIQGGISVTFNSRVPSPWPVLIGHLGLGLMGAVVIYWFGDQLLDTYHLLEVQSQKDGLTGIHNRRFFDDFFQREFLRSKRDNIPLSVIITDIDYFKDFNDVYGHLTGDDCLIEIAETISSVIKRPGDITARIGGEEFGVLLPNTALDGALTVAELMRSRIEDLSIPHQGNPVNPFVTISLGVCCYSGGEIKLDEFYDRADQALYRAKQSGRNRVCSCEQNPGSRREN